MKALHLLIIGILIGSGVLLAYSSMTFELAEQYFENQRNGLICNKPGSSCPFPDFEGPMFYGIIGLVIFFVGLFVIIFRERLTVTKKILGIVLVLTGIPAFVFGISAYLDDYNHFLLMVKNCSNSPCMSPNVFANIQFVIFYGIHGAILIAIGVIFLVRRRIKP